MMICEKADFCSSVSAIMSESPKSNVEKLKAAAYKGRLSVPRNVSNADEDEIPIMETFGVVPRTFDKKGRKKGSDVLSWEQNNLDHMKEYRNIVDYVTHIHPLESIE